MPILRFVAPILMLTGAAMTPTPPHRATPEVPAVAAAAAPDAAGTTSGRHASRPSSMYHFMLWNFTTETINVHLSSSLLGCSTMYTDIKPGQAFERGNYHDKWDNGICAGACWTSVDAYTAVGNHHVVHFTPSDQFPAIKVTAGVGAASIAGSMATLVAFGPIAAGPMLIAGGAIALAGVLGSGGPCHGFDLAIWSDPKTGGWLVSNRYDGDYNVFKSEILPKVGK